MSSQSCLQVGSIEERRLYLLLLMKYKCNSIRNSNPRYRQCSIGRRRRRCGPLVGRPRGTSPWCPPALLGLAGDREEGAVPTRPAKHHGGGSPLRLLPLFPGPHNAHAPPPYTLKDPPRGMERGARHSAGSTSGTVHLPPPGKGDVVSRVWALSPPGTTDWAAFGRRVSGARSVARSPPPPPA